MPVILFCFVLFCVVLITINKIKYSQQAAELEAPAVAHGVGVGEAGPYMMHDGNVSRGEQEDGAGAAVRWQTGDPEVAPPAECEPGSPEVQLLAPPGDGTVTFFAFPSGGGLALVYGNPPLFQQPEIGGVRGGEEPKDDPVFFRSHRRQWRRYLGAEGR